MTTTELKSILTKLKDKFVSKTDIDTTPTANSTNLITSGGVYTALQSGGGGGVNIQFYCEINMDDHLVIYNSPFSTIFTADAFITEIATTELTTGVFPDVIFRLTSSTSGARLTTMDYSTDGMAISLKFDRYDIDNDTFDDNQYSFVTLSGQVVAYTIVQNY